MYTTQRRELAWETKYKVYGLTTMYLKKKMDGKDVKEIIIGIKTKVIWLSNDLE